MQTIQAVISRLTEAGHAVNNPYEPDVTKIRVAEHVPGESVLVYELDSDLHFTATDDLKQILIDLGYAPVALEENQIAGWVVT